MKFRILIKICIIFSLISPCIMSNGRKYDVETEAFKLYGEDFKTVLRRFRKTPDYLKILRDKMHDLSTYFSEMALQILHYYHTKMAQRVNDIIGVTRNYEENTSPQNMLYFHAYDNRRQEGNGETIEPDKIGLKCLDGYTIFSHPLTVPERNSFRDLGFEFAGNLIHTLIQNMGPVDSPPKSTRQPYGGHDADKNVVTTTTDHPHTHEVTSESTISTPLHVPEDRPTPDTFRFRYRP